MENRNFNISTILATLLGAVLIVLIVYMLLNGNENATQSTSEESAPVETSSVEDVSKEVTTTLMEVTESTTIEVTTQDTTSSVNPDGENYNYNVTENVGNPEFNIVVNGSQVEVTTSPTDEGNGVYNIVVN
jgi:hypothetical protein